MSSKHTLFSIQIVSDYKIEVTLCVSRQEAEATFVAEAELMALRSFDGYDEAKDYIENSGEHDGDVLQLQQHEVVISGNPR